MADRRLLYLFDHGLVAYRRADGGLLADAEFAGDEAGQAQFSAYVAGQRSAVFSVLADVGEEAYHYEKVPFVRGADRKALFTRKLAQFVYGSPYSLVISHGREKTGRRDERVVFTGLARPGQFEHWLTAIVQNEAPLAELHSLALVSTALLKRLKRKDERLLLISRTRAGLRQSYFEQGVLRLSRLTPAALLAGLPDADAALQEARRLHHYLAGQRAFARDSVLPVLFLLSGPDVTDLQGALADEPNLSAVPLDLAQAASACGVQPVPQDGLSETLFLHLMQTHPPARQLAAPALRRFDALRRARRNLPLAAAAACACACTAAAGLLWQSSQLNDQSAILRGQAQTVAAQIRSIEASLPQPPYAPETLARAVAGLQTLERGNFAPRVLLLPLSRSLDRFPDIDLHSMEWSLQPPRPASPAAPAQSALASLSVQAELASGSAQDMREGLDRVAAFVDDLRTQRVEVVVLRQPFDLDAGFALRAAADTQAPARFALRLTTDHP
ncbi:MAG: hypothetical protein KF778_19725 [Rhodocyclaceae bacterium]|nr:hypothetical protein [Rhodocyclaceae bacterium]